MRKSSFLAVVFWIAVVAAPLAVCAVAAAQLPDAATVPLHWSSGKPDRWGSPDELAAGLWIMGALMSTLNLALSAGYAFNDRLYEAGATHGVSRDGARQMYVVGAVIVAVMTCLILFAITAMVGSTL